MQSPEATPTVDAPQGVGVIDLQAVAAACTARGFNAEVVADRHEARRRVHELIPDGADVTNGGSMTLREIGLMDDLQAGEKWRWRRRAIYAMAESDKRVELRRWATTADYMLGSVNGLAATGEAVSLDAGGTRVGAYCYGAGKVIWVVGRNKVVPTLSDAIERVRTHAFDLEDQRMQREMGQPAFAGKWVIVECEPLPDRIKLILVDEDLGF